MSRSRYFNRRSVLGVSAAALGLGVYGAWSYTHPAIAKGTTRISVEEAHRRAIAGDLILLDVRRPDEWQSTGIGEGALPLDMRRSDFIDALLQVTGGDTSKPLAVICARGVRSARMTQALTDAGFTALIDVPEGMLGSFAGSGWLAKGLPVVHPS